MIGPVRRARTDARSTFPALQRASRVGVEGGDPQAVLELRGFRWHLHVSTRRNTAEHIPSFPSWVRWPLAGVSANNIRVAPSPSAATVADGGRLGRPERP